MQKIKRVVVLVSLVAILVLSIVGICSIFSKSNKTVAKAEEVANSESFNFKLLTDSDGEQSYSVSIKADQKPSAKVVIIPESYNGLPVTEIAMNGFMSCAQLERVFIPTCMTKIGNNAFMNCPNLERLSLSYVQSIGMNAFALCPKLDKMFFPKTLKTVGANILRNNSNTVLIQSSEDEVNSGWESTWSSYFTGNVIYGADVGEAINYTEILDSSSSQVIGYEIPQWQFLTDENADLVIYNSFRKDENSEYLPVLNVCSEAFTLSKLHSITFKEREDAPKFNHKINLRSNAFLGFLGAGEIVFEVGVTFNHPTDLNVAFQSFIEEEEDEKIIKGDSDGHSMKVFAETSLNSITLPFDIEFIPQRMFYQNPYLKSIKWYNTEDDKINVLPNVKKIGSEAFTSCVGLKSLYIPSSVVMLGDDAFFRWGKGDDNQELNIDFYEDDLPEGWSVGWNNGIDKNNATINYKALTKVIIDYQDDAETRVEIGVKPGLEMPVLEKPMRPGYVFKGIYAEENGSGLQFYTENMAVGVPWEIGDSDTLYVYWEIETYYIFYPSELNELISPDYLNGRKFTVKDYFDIDLVENEGYRYIFEPSRIEEGTVGNQYLTYKKEPMKFRAHFVVDDWKGNAVKEDIFFTVEEEVFYEKLEDRNFSFEWNLAFIPLGTHENLTIIGTWTPNRYPITYKNIRNGLVNDNPNEYIYGQELVLKAATIGGYYVVWDNDFISDTTEGEVVITATYLEKTLNECYNNGVYEIWTLNQFCELKDQPNGGSGRTYYIRADISGSYYSRTYLQPMNEFRGVLNGLGHTISELYIDTSSGGNLGFCRINYGTIKNLMFRMGYQVDSNFSNVCIGLFAGINCGRIECCTVKENSYRSILANAGGDSYAGCFVGINDGTIVQCLGGSSIEGNCNIGTIAGQNTGIISNCNVGNGNFDIRYTYSGLTNACVGGIVGLQVNGQVTNCSFQGKITWSANYKSDKYNSFGEDREMQPCIGIMIGYNQGGSISGSSWQAKSGVPDGYIVGAEMEPVIVTWTTGALWWQETHTHNQGLYFRNEECGRVD